MQTIKNDNTQTLSLFYRIFILLIYKDWFQSEHFYAPTDVSTRLDTIIMEWPSLEMFAMVNIFGGISFTSDLKVDIFEKPLWF